MRSIPLMSPNITEDDIAAAAEVLRSGSLVQGKHVEAFEKAIGEYVGTKQGRSNRYVGGAARIPKSSAALIG